MHARCDAKLRDPFSGLLVSHFMYYVLLLLLQTYCVAARLAGDGLVSDGGSTQGRFTKWCRFTSVAYCCEPEPYTYRSTRD